MNNKDENLPEELRQHTPVHFPMTSHVTLPANTYTHNHFTATLYRSTCVSCHSPLNGYHQQSYLLFQLPLINIWLLLSYPLRWQQEKLKNPYRHTELKESHYSVFTGYMFFLMHIQQCQSTEGTRCHYHKFWLTPTDHAMHCVTLSHHRSVQKDGCWVWWQAMVVSWLLTLVQSWNYS